MLVATCIGRVCSFPGCWRTHQAKGYCKSHWLQQRRGNPLTPLNSTKRPDGTPPIIEWDEVPCPNPELKGPCHVFRGAKNDKGYGEISISRKESPEGKGKRIGVHLYRWKKEVGPIPKGLVADHRCRVRSCCNPDHIRIVTRHVNSTENIIGTTWQKNLAKTHCKRGHEFTSENTYVTSLGGRQCMQCVRDRVRAKRVLTRKAISGHD